MFDGKDNVDVYLRVGVWHTSSTPTELGVLYLMLVLQTSDPYGVSLSFVIDAGSTNVRPLRGLVEICN